MIPSLSTIIDTRVFAITLILKENDLAYNCLYSENFSKRAPYAIEIHNQSPSLIIQ